MSQLNLMSLFTSLDALYIFGQNILELINFEKALNYIV